MTVFDFEHENCLDGNASLSIRVRVTDQAGAWIEKILNRLGHRHTRSNPELLLRHFEHNGDLYGHRKAPPGPIANPMYATDADANDSFAFRSQM